MDRTEYNRLYMRMYNAQRKEKLCIICQKEPVRSIMAKTCKSKDCQEKHRASVNNAASKQKRAEAKAGRKCSDCPADISNLKINAKRCKACAAAVKRARSMERNRAVRANRVPVRAKPESLPVCCICDKAPVSRKGAKLCINELCHNEYKKRYEKEQRKRPEAPVKKVKTAVRLPSGRTVEENIEILGAISDLREKGQHEQAAAMKAFYFPKF